MAKEALAPHLERAVRLFETDDWDGARVLAAGLRH